MEKIFVDGKQVEVEKIGEGSFAQVYRSMSDKDTVYALVNGCPMKEVLAGIKHQHLPYITCHQPDGNTGVYSMPYYQPLSSNEAYEIYEQIRSTHLKAMREIDKATGWVNANRIQYAEETLNLLKKNDVVPPTVVDAMTIVYNKMVNLGKHCGFDIHDGNFSEDEEGNIIILDVAWEGWKD